MEMGHVARLRGIFCESLVKHGCLWHAELEIGLNGCDRGFELMSY